MGRIHRTRQVMWVVGPVQSTVVRERSLYIAFGGQPQRLKPYYTQAVFSIDMFAKRPAPTEILDDVSIFCSMDGVSFARATGINDQWHWNTITPLERLTSLMRAPVMHYSGSLGAAQFQTGLFPEYWLLEYSATSIGAIPVMLFLVSAVFTGSPPYGIE